MRSKAKKILSSWTKGGNGRMTNSDLAPRRKFARALSLFRLESPSRAITGQKTEPEINQPISIKRKSDTRSPAKPDAMETRIKKGKPESTKDEAFDHPTFDLAAYVNRYSGHGKVLVSSSSTKLFLCVVLLLVYFELICFVLVCVFVDSTPALHRSSSRTSSSRCISRCHF